MNTEELTRLPKSERDQVIHETARRILEIFRATGAVEYKEITDMYAALKGMDVIVRRESPERISEMVQTNSSLNIDFPEGQRYSNAVIWNPALGSRGIENAYMEGYGQLNGIVTVIGFAPNKSLSIESLSDASKHFAGLDRTFVRSVEGPVHAEDVVFVSVRIPSHILREEELTERELEIRDTYNEKRDRNGNAIPAFIHRGFLFTKNLKRQ